MSKKVEKIKEVMGMRVRLFDKSSGVSRATTDSVISHLRYTFCK